MATFSAGIGEYVKRAFLYRWNLLAVFGATAAALLSPIPDALLPLIAAGEIIYLTGLVSNTRFRQAIDAERHQAATQQTAATAQRSLQDIVATFPFEARQRFEQLRNRCIEMRDIAHGVRGRQQAPAGEDANTQALDRMLWVFLRLQTTQLYLQRFLEKANEVEIRNRIKEAESRLKSQASADERIKRSLEDSLQVQQQRLENREKAQQNLDYVRVELDRIEAKIQAITEAAVNRQDPDFLTSQIDSVSESMQSTEKAINELQQLTGIVEEMQTPPLILEADLGQVQR
jgi:DNA repair exonuclease SbcCD ATPase subunit